MASSRYSSRLTDNSPWSLNITLRGDPPVAAFLQKLTNSVALTKAITRTNIIRTASRMHSDSDGNFDHNSSDRSDANSDDLVAQLRQKARELLSIADRLEKQAAKERSKTAHRQKREKRREGREKGEENFPLSSFLLPPSSETTPRQFDAIASLTPHILLSRSEYQTCHIRVPGAEKRYPAIFVDGDYFTLVKVFPDLESTLAAKAKLDWSGDSRKGSASRHPTVITQISKGYALWAWEPEATSDLSPGKEKREKRRKKRGKRTFPFPLLGEAAVCPYGWLRLWIRKIQRERTWENTC